MSLRCPNYFSTAMKVRLLLVCLATACAAAAQDSFPGLQSLLSPAEWKRAGLDRLSPDQIGVIDAALIRYHVARQTVGAATAAAHTPTSPEAPANASAAEAAVIRSRNWEKFGLQKITGDWRTQPPMKAKVTASCMPRAASTRRAKDARACFAVKAGGGMMPLTGSETGAMVFNPRMRSTSSIKSHSGSISAQPSAAALARAASSSACAALAWLSARSVR